MIKINKKCLKSIKNALKSFISLLFSFSESVVLVCIQVPWAQAHGRTDGQTNLVNLSLSDLGILLVNSRAQPNRNWCLCCSNMMCCSNATCHSKCQQTMCCTQCNVELKQPIMTLLITCYIKYPTFVHFEQSIQFNTTHSLPIFSQFVSFRRWGPPNKFLVSKFRN